MEAFGELYFIQVSQKVNQIYRKDPLLPQLNSVYHLSFMSMQNSKWNKSRRNHLNASKFLCLAVESNLSAVAAVAGLNNISLQIVIMLGISNSCWRGIFFMCLMISSKHSSFSLWNIARRASDSIWSCVVWISSTFSFP